MGDKTKKRPGNRTAPAPKSQAPRPVGTPGAPLNRAAGNGAVAGQSTTAEPAPTPVKQQGGKGDDPIVAPKVTNSITERGAHAVWPDPAKMTDEQVEAEIDRNFARSEKLDVSRADFKKWFDRNQVLYEVLERRAKAADERVRIEAAKTTMARVAAEAEQLQKRFEEELAWVAETLDSVTFNLNTYLGYYNTAYASFTSVLAEAKRRSEARAAAENVLLGVLIGTGIGLAAGTIFKAAKGLYKIAAEAASEVVEAVAGKALQVDPPNVYAPPTNLDPRLRSDPAGETILQAWRGLAMFNSTTLAMGKYQVSVERLAFKLEKEPSIELVQKMYSLLVKAEPALLSGGLDTLHANVIEFWELARNPLLKRSPLELEQDMWIRWIEGLPANLLTRLAALDEDAIENHLHRIGVLGDDGRSRLGVDFGWLTTGGDVIEATLAGKREGDQMNQIGRYGVVLRDLKPGKVGRVTIRDDIYEKIGKKLPPWADPDAVQRTFPAVTWMDPVKGSQIVRIMGSTERGLEVTAARDADGNEAFV